MIHWDSPAFSRQWSTQALLLKYLKSWFVTLWARVALMYDSNALDRAERLGPTLPLYSICLHVRRGQRQNI